MEPLDAIRRLTKRYAKAREAFENGQVLRVDEGHIAVIGKSQPHVLDVHERRIGECDCEDFMYRRQEIHGLCWHRMAAYLRLEQDLESDAGCDSNAVPTGDDVHTPSSVAGSVSRNS